jgi:hypothetical protein
MLGQLKITPKLGYVHRRWPNQFQWISDLTSHQSTPLYYISSCPCFVNICIMLNSNLNSTHKLFFLSISVNQVRSGAAPNSLLTSLARLSPSGRSPNYCGAPCPFPVGEREGIDANFPRFCATPLVSHSTPSKSTPNRVRSSLHSSNQPYHPVGEVPGTKPSSLCPMSSRGRGGLVRKEKTEAASKSTPSASPTFP